MGNSQFKLAESKDMNEILEIIEAAKQLLAAQNSPQWQNGYPNKEVIEKDIEAGNAYVLLLEGQIIGTVALQKERETDYDTITEGTWENPDEAYVTIHRIAVAANYRGQNLAKKMIECAQKEAKKWGFTQIRVDTHRKNLGMQKLLRNSGFEYKGIVYVSGYTDNERLAYQQLLS